MSAALVFPAPKAARTSDSKEKILKVNSSHFGAFGVIVHFGGEECGLMGSCRLAIIRSRRMMLVSIKNSTDPENCRADGSGIAVSDTP
jgi:hypothetical protein